MNSNRMGLWIAVMSLGSLISLTAVADDDVKIAKIQIAPGIVMLTGQGGNLAVSHGPDGTLVIDDQYAHMSEGILAAIRELESPPLRYVVNTHWHTDHTGGNANMTSAGAVIVAHDNVRVRMSQDQFNPALDRETKASPPEALPVVTFSADATLHFNGQSIHAVHVNPAHTDGDSVIFFTPANVVHTGDLYFNGLYPFVDFSSGGDPRGMIAAVDQVLSQVDDQTQIIPGHGPLSNRRELAVYRGMLDTVCDRIGAAIAAGKSVDEIVAMKPTAEYDAVWGGGFLDPERFVRVIYAGLAAGIAPSNAPSLPH